MSARLCAALALAAPAAAAAQAMPGMAMPEGTMPGHADHPPAAMRHAGRHRRRPATAPAGGMVTDMAGIRHGPGQSAAPAPHAPTQAAPGMAGMAGMEDKNHSSAPTTGTTAGSAMAMPGMTPGAAMAPGAFMAPTRRPSDAAMVGDAPPPPTPTGHYADRDFPPAAMAAARARMMREGGGELFYQLLFNLAEYQAHGAGGYRWDGEGWLGGDIDRLWLKSEGSGDLGRHGRGGLDEAEAQLLYSRAIGPYFNLQTGVRHDFAPTPTRTYASFGVEGLAPYLFQVEARLFLATTGQALGRLEGWWDGRLTQRLVLQPRVELNLAAQDDAPTRTGAGLVDAELGLRLRYEVRREFAPYVGVSHRVAAGRTARFLRGDGLAPATIGLVAGARFWF